LAAATVQVLAEALALVKKSGLPPESMSAALENHGVRSGLTDMKLPGMLKGDFEPHFSVKHMLKDMELAIGMAQSHSLDLPVTTSAARVLYDAAGRGWADLDFSSVLKFYADEQESVAPAPVEPEPVPAAEPAENPEITPAAAPEENTATEAASAPEAEPSPQKPPGLMQRLFGKKSG
ncbi:MAG: NAD-binding protein, partial [Verrucomicrobiota bacterium]